MMSAGASAAISNFLIKAVVASQEAANAEEANPNPNPDSHAENESMGKRNKLEESLGLGDSANNALLAGGVFAALSAASLIFFCTRKGEEVEQLTLGNSVSKVDQRTNPAHAQAAARKAPTEQAAQMEAEDAEFAEFFQTLDRAGPFAKELSGQPTWESIKLVKKLCQEESHRRFQPIRERLLKERLDCFKQKKWEGYKDSLKQMVEAFQRVQNATIVKGVQFSGFDITEFAKTMQQYTKAHPDKQQELAEQEASVRIAFENYPPVKESRDEIKALLMEKIKMEGEVNDKVAELLKTHDAQQIQQITALEKNKVYDDIYIRHGVKFHYLEHAAEHYKLGDDDDVKELVNSLKMRAQQAQEKAILEVDLGKSKDELVGALNIYGTVEVDPAREVISKEDFIKIQSLITKHSFKMTQEM